jgi:putative transposase
VGYPCQPEHGVEAWRNWRIEGEHPYLHLDGIVMKRSWEDFARSWASARAPRKTKSGWSAFLRHLVDRDRKGVQLVISDARRDLVESVSDFLPEARYQPPALHGALLSQRLQPRPFDQGSRGEPHVKAIHAQESQEAADNKALIIGDLRASKMAKAATSSSRPSTRS